MRHEAPFHGQQLCFCQAATHPLTGRTLIKWSPRGDHQRRGGTAATFLGIKLIRHRRCSPSSICTHTHTHTVYPKTHTRAAPDHKVQKFSDELEASRCEHTSRWTCSQETANQWAAGHRCEDSQLRLTAEQKWEVHVSRRGYQKRVLNWFQFLTINKLQDKRYCSLYVSKIKTYKNRSCFTMFMHNLTPLPLLTVLVITAVKN